MKRNRVLRTQEVRWQQILAKSEINKMSSVTGCYLKERFIPTYFTCFLDPHFRFSLGIILVVIHLGSSGFFFLILYNLYQVSDPVLRHYPLLLLPQDLI